MGSQPGEGLEGVRDRGSGEPWLGMSWVGLGFGGVGLVGLRGRSESGSDVASS